MLFICLFCGGDIFILLECFSIHGDKGYEGLACLQGISAGMYGIVRCLMYGVIRCVVII